MVLPSYDRITLPILEFAADGKEWSVQEARVAISKVFSLSKNELRVLIPSGTKSLFDDRVHWAIQYLLHAGLIRRTKRGHYKITSRGTMILKDRPNKIDKRYLTRFPSFVEYVKPKLR